MTENRSSPTPARKAEWRPATESSAAPPKPAKTVRIFRLMAAMTALAGVIIGIILLIRTPAEPHFIALPITQYNYKFPPIAQADRDSKALGELFASQNTFDYQQKDQFELLLSGLREYSAGDKAKQPVIVYVSAHAMFRDSRIYLLLGEADPDDPKEWVDLQKIVTAMTQLGSPHRLLILDIMQPFADLRLGAVADDMAGHVEDLFKDTEGLSILSACRRGEISLAGESEGHTAFGYYLLRGLRGAADGWNSKHHTNGSVSVGELSAYVAARVNRWASQCRNRRQTPILLGRGEDFELTGIKESIDWKKLLMHETEGSETAAEPPAYPPCLKEGWKYLEDPNQRALVSKAPWLFRRLEAELLFAEVRWRAGVEETQVCADWGKEKEKVELSTKRLASVVDQAVPRQRQGDQAMMDQIRKTLQAVRAAKLETDEAVTRERAALKALVKDPASQARLEWSLVEVGAKESAPTVERVRALRDLLKNIAPESPVLPILEPLANLEPREVPVQAEAIGEMLRVEAARGKAKIPDARVFPWLRASWEAASAKAKKGKEDLLDNHSKTLTEAFEQLQDAKRTFDDIQSSIKSVQDLQADWDLAMVTLPAYVPYLLARCEAGGSSDSAGTDFSPVESDWLKAAALTATLAETLGKPLDGLSESGVRELLRQALESHALLKPILEDLVQDIQEVIAKTEKNQLDHSDPQLVAEIDALLTTPFVPSAKREALWRARWSLERRCHDKVHALDQKDEKDGRPSAIPSDSAPDQAAQENREAHRAAKRIRFSVELLKLGGFKPEVLARWQPEFDSAYSGNRAARERVADFLHTAWSRDLPKQIEQTETSLAARDRLTRILPPFDRLTDALLTGEARDYASSLREHETSAFSRWLGRQ